jgi:hypothetical protein
MFYWLCSMLCTQAPVLDPWRHVENKGEYVDKSGMEVGSMDWINLAQDRDRWRALLNVVINLRVP